MDMKPKNLLQRMLDYAFAELERRARIGEAEPESTAGEHDAVHARSDVFSGSDEQASEHAHAIEDERAGEDERARQADKHDRLSSPPVQALEAVRAHTGTGVTLRWSIGPEDVARAQSLMSGKPVLCLRVVSFTTARDDVLREVQDRPGVELQGECELADAPERAVVALGLRAGERFVSIAHHVL
jgi:hypothetical protein